MAEDTPLTEEPSPVAEVRLAAGAWLARLGGDVRLRNGSGEAFNLTDDLDLRDLEATFNAELNIRKHDYFDLHLSGFSFSTDQSGTMPRSAVYGDLQFGAGDAYRTSFEMTSVNMEVRFPVYRPFNNSDQKFNKDGRRRVRFRFGPLVGARYIDVEQAVEQVGIGRENAGGEWLGIHGGAHFELMFRPDGDFRWIDRLVLEAAASAGPLMGGDGGVFWQVQSTFRAYITENFGVHVGYRLVDMNAKNDGYRLEGGLQGLFVGGTVSF